MKVLGGNVLGGHEEDVVKTLSGEYEKSNFVVGRKIVSWRQLGSRRNLWGEEIRDQEDPVCQSYSTVIRTVFIIKNKGLTSREYQEFVVRWEGQVGSRRRP